MRNITTKYIRDTKDKLNLLVRKFRQRYFWLVAPYSAVCSIASIAVLGFFVASVAGYVIGSDIAAGNRFVDVPEQVIEEYRQLTQSSHAELSLLTRRLATLEARLSRLDVLGKQLTSLHNLEDSEFDFAADPGMGGLLGGDGRSENVRQIAFSLDRLEINLDETEMQIKILTDLIGVSDLKKQMLPVGWPVDKGWVSSRFGYRISPFTGYREIHHGLDIAGRTGNRVYAVASGIVKRTRTFSDYGNFVEIDHGKGYLTRYAHNQVNLVQVGDTVKKGDVIALMGSSGRSTGPHLHFEVVKDGRRIDPAHYLSQ